MTEAEKDEKIAEFKKLQWELKKRKVQLFVKEAPGKAYEFCKAHGKEVVAGASAAIVVGKKLTGLIEDVKEKNHRDRRIYDHSLDRWCYLKRKMRPDEEREFKERRRKGETVYDILSSMRLLKY